MDKPAASNNAILALVIATVSELVGLALWVQFVDDEKQLAGIAILLVGLLLERIAVIMTTKPMYAGHPLPRNFYALVIFSAFVESAVWIIWLIIWDANAVAALPIWLIPTIAMFVMQLLAHSWQMSFALNKPPIFQFSKDRLTIVFSAIEAIGTAGWLLLVRDDKLVLGIVVLALTFTVEHIVQGKAIDKASPPDFS